jgi:LDH2 family malate/lactate/ureidoglycolate dehydrogenase
VHAAGRRIRHRHVAVDNAFHYLWGGGYVIDAAEKGYIAYTCCTAALAEVVPFGGKFPTLGTNPHSWAFPTTTRGRFPDLHRLGDQHRRHGPGAAIRPREGKQLPPGQRSMPKDGNETTDPNKVVALQPFGQHKGYGLSLIDE